MSERWGWFAKSPALCFAMLFLLAGAYFGSSRDFGNFLFSIPILPLLLLAALTATVWAARLRVERARVIVACTLICLTPPTYHFSYELVQRIDFLFWAPTHYRLLAQASKKDGIIMGWDSWGIAGQDTFSYLVTDTEDRLGSKERADKWTKQIGQSCGVWEARRMWPRLYIVTTYTNCPYDGVEPAN
jgi:hypothetical protein